MPRNPERTADTVRHAKRTARFAGACYLVVGVCGLFAHMYARGAVHVPGDAAATARNIAEHATLFRLGFVADLGTATSFLFVGLLLYRLFRHVHREVAAAMVVFVAIGTGMILVNLLYHFAALVVATDPSYAAALGDRASDALVLLFLDLHGYGYLIGGILFGLWLLPLGYLAYTSGLFPRALGVALVLGCFGYLTDTVLGFVLPDASGPLSATLTTVAAVAEFWMVGYLLAVGVRSPKTSPPASPAVRAGTVA